VAAARAHVRAEETRRAAADREYYPDLTVSTSYNSMWDMPEHRWMVGVEVNLPIQLGKRRGAVEEAEASRARFESEVRRLSDGARTRAAIAARRLEEAQHVLHLFDERLLPAARDQVDAARNGFVVSQNSFLSVIQAEKNLRQVELEYRMAQATLDRRAAERDEALGRIPGLASAGGER
jgi:outer membrane protein TolC